MEKLKVNLPKISNKSTGQQYRQTQSYDENAMWKGQKRENKGNKISTRTLLQAWKQWHILST